MRLAALVLACSILGCSTPADIVGSGCENCHRPSTFDKGIEEQHPLFALRCAECHGGDPAAQSVERAHVTEAAPGKNIRTRSIMELAATDPSYRRFINPADPIAAPQTCGNLGPQGEQGCHQAIVDASQVSVHMTNVGVASQPRFAVGLIAERARLGVVGVVDQDFQPANAPPGTLGRVDPVTIAAVIETPTSSDAPALYSYSLSKSCSGCHLSLYGTNGQGRPNAPFAGGCTACHMYYADDGVSQSDDPARDTTGETAHPQRHMIGRTVPDSQCLRCHSRSLRIGQQWRGWRERTSMEDDGVFSNAKRVDQPLYGRPPGFFIEDEDTRDQVDFTPPDIHMEKGMACVDCHLAGDGHGDGSMRDTMGREVGIECESCHGTFTSTAGLDGNFFTSRGEKLTRVRREGDKVFLKGALDGIDHPVTQIVNLRPSAAQQLAHNPTNHNSLECYACHTSWMQNVYSLRRTLDYRVPAENPVNGIMEPGTVTDYDEIQVRGAIGNPGTDPNAFTGYHLGLNTDGKIAPMMVENARFDVIVPCNPANEPPNTCVQSPGQPIFGKKIIDGWFGHTNEGRRSFEWRPVFPHATATRANVQACTQCHPRPFEVSDTRVRATYGFGTGRYTAIDPFTRTAVDLTQMIDDSGTPVISLPQPSSAPVPIGIIQRALSYKVEPPL